MTDREMLELAAQAAGIELTDFHGVLVRPDVEAGCPPWNPLDDDGDALRLAAAQRLDVWFLSKNSVVQVAGAGQPITTEAICAETDPHAATRRAIVRAAAAIQLAKVPA